MTTDYPDYFHARTSYWWQRLQLANIHLQCIYVCKPFYVDLIWNAWISYLRCNCCCVTPNWKMDRDQDLCKNFKRVCYPSTLCMLCLYKSLLYYHLILYCFSVCPVIYCYADCFVTKCLDVWSMNVDSSWNITNLSISCKLFNSDSIAS